jgi:hypothetical protein
MSTLAYALNDKIHHSMEKVILKTESVHLCIATKPWRFIEKAKLLRPVSRKIRIAIASVIGKSYRGMRDLNEMSHQLNENYLGLTGWTD